ncbi:hypothetical protein PF010_g32700 [Phytophthora fragariae]|uniref:Uncharacterized protein n=1 Tax=Phytophthora fragariae TaxID=53985 RepID=A0A6G0JEM1_9STRA|nr:hypothetical protein PF010_g32700 [Phytophthora fragariae]
MELPTHLKSLETAAITFVWAFYIAYNMSLFAFKGFQPAVLNYVQATTPFQITRPVQLFACFISLVLLLYLD